MNAVNQLEAGVWDLLEAFQSVSVELARFKDSAIHGLVLDNGRGFVVSERDHLPGHLGLLALNERSLPAGGRTKIESEPGLGTKVEFWMPTA